MNTPLKITAAILIAVPMAFWGVVGYSFLVPSQTSDHVWIDVGSLAELPADGQPCLIPLMVPLRDAWNRLPDREVGSIFVRRVPGEQAAVALHAWDGYYRAAVRYDVVGKCFCSCCFLVRFDLEGRVIPDKQISNGPYTDMTSLETKVAGGRVLVRVTVPGGSG